MKPAPFDYRAAASTADALAALGDAAVYAKVCGGSQSLGPMLNLRLAQVDCLVDISRLEALRAFSLHDDRLRIGAAVTHARIEDGELPDVTRGLLPFVAAGIAYRAVRNRGTIGGSLAHADPAADWVSTMRLLGASLLVAGRDGERRTSAAELFVGPFTTTLQADEILVAVEVPRFSAAARWSYRKTCRKPGEFADAIAAVWTDGERGVARAVIGACDGMPHVIEGDAALRALREPRSMSRALDDAGVEGDYEREVHAVMLRRALSDVFPA
jgi:carbon-monoxide dehydrogenase medium subunit